MRHDKPEQSGNHPDRGNASRAMVLLAGLLFVLTSFPMLALDPATANTQYGLRTWTSEDGLPENFVAASAQTPDGYLWFGTEEGLGRFDGVRFTTFLDRTNINALLVSRDGSLWIAQEEGLARYKNGQMTMYSTESAFKGGTISAMSEGSDGSIWIATRTGLHRYFLGRFEIHQATDASRK